MVAAGDFLGTNVENVGRGFRLPGTTGPAVANAHATVELVGIEHIIAQLLLLPAVAKRALGHSMFLEMDRVIDNAKANYVPEETGATKDSGKVKGPFVTRDMVEVTGSFGPVSNGRGPYTVPLHEIPEPPAVSVGGRSARHQKGTWKFLQIPFLLAMPGMVGRIEVEFHKLLGRIGLRP